MCGISGFVDGRASIEADSYPAIARRMALALKHRGPDSEGIWCDATCGIALSHRRLAIIDLSPAGHQPMQSACGRYVLVYNGEIYNFQELRINLESRGHRFNGHSDTEIILGAFSEWGITKALARFNGMFAIAVWDRQACTLDLIRDRLGQKPLYVGWSGHTLLFASELKAFHGFPGFCPQIDRNALTLLLRRGCIAAPYTIYQDVFKVQPGCYIRITLADLASGQHTLKQQPYWSATQVMETGSCQPFQGNKVEAIDALELLLRDAVKRCMIADVPLGAFLSGGIDSSLITALMQAQSTQRVRTYSIGFHEQNHNEAHYAAAVANHLGTEHTELYVSEQDALTLIPQLPQLYDEPFADSSQIPTYLLAKLTRQHVTVALSGDGGDELFGGYAKYHYLNRLQPLTQLPPVVSATLSYTIRHLPMPTAAQWQALPFTSAGNWLAQHDLKQQTTRIATLLDTTRSPTTLYQHLASIWKEPAQLVIGADEPATLLTTPGSWPQVKDPIRQAMAVDLQSYLPDDILVKVDRAAMAVSLETRIPLLDHRVVEFAATLPWSMLYQRGCSKLPLRHLLNRYVPSQLIDRPKMGFKIPLGTWLRKELRTWAEALLEPSRLHSEGFFTPHPIQQKWQEHVTGQADWSGYLWPILMFQTWRNHWLAASITEHHLT